jgi:hypothetical protein
MRFPRQIKSCQMGLTWGTHPTIVPAKFDILQGPERMFSMIIYDKPEMSRRMHVRIHRDQLREVHS